ncbi:MAG TPA: helix-turn-helix transcriptional regulator [Chloroflexota bacterium]|jgi:PadR family transcriptional regulator PadR|nr:helix-turn-helix transcriptional regulator [Chloroflexota bacterium]
MARRDETGASQAAANVGELPSGTTPALILSVLADGPLHGYGLAKEIERRSGGFFTGSWGSLYPALQRLEQDGLIEGVWEPHPPQGRRRRRVYKLTPTGKSAARQTAGRWRQFAERILQVIGHNGVADEAMTSQGAVRATR